MKTLVDKKEHFYSKNFYTIPDPRQQRAEVPKKELTFSSSHSSTTGDDTADETYPQPSTSTSGLTKRRAPLCSYENDQLQVAVVTGSAAEGEQSREVPTADKPAPSLPKPPRYRERKPIFDIDLTYPSFRLKREARQAQGLPIKKLKSFEGDQRIDLSGCNSSEDERLYNYYYSFGEESPRWATTDIDSTSDEENI